MDWLGQFDREINQAEFARASGKEGMARVCARRAAGIVIGEWLVRNGEPISGPSSYDRIRQFILLKDIPEAVIEKASHFLVKVDPEFNLPNDMDLIQDARWLANALRGSY